MTAWPANSLLRQKRVDAICARILHAQEVKRFRGLSTFVDWFAAAVPLLYLPVRYLAKGTDYQSMAEHSWEIVAALLLVVVLLKLIFKWQDKAEQHSRLLGENLSLITQANNLIDKPGGSNQQEEYLFSLLADSVEKQDRDSLGEIGELQRRQAYRRALREIDDALCPQCQTSPWVSDEKSWFKKKNVCQLCGHVSTTSAQQSVGAH